MTEGHAASAPGPVVWVTGASSGIGRATTLELARRGFRIAVSARNAEALGTLAAEAPGVEIRAYPLDVTDPAESAAVVARIEAEMGPIAIGLLNAGVYLPVDGLAPRVADFHRSFAVNLGGVVNGLVPLAERMTRRRSGQIAIVSSVAGYSGLPTCAAYGATKAGLINMAESLKFDLDRAGVQIRIIDPGFVETGATDGNAFPMPFLLPVTEAARRIADGLAGTGFEITFPRRFTWILKFGRLLPWGLYFPLVARLTGWSKKPRM